MRMIWTDGACKGNPGPGGYGVVSIENDTLARRITSYVAFIVDTRRMTAKLDEMCEVSLENIGANNLINALEKYILDGNIMRFSRFKKGDTSGKNYRENCKYIPPNALLNIMKQSLMEKGIDTNLVENQELIPAMYVATLEQSKYKGFLTEQEKVRQ